MVVGGIDNTDVIMKLLCIIFDIFNDIRMINKIPQLKNFKYILYYLNKYRSIFS